MPLKRNHLDAGRIPTQAASGGEDDALVGALQNTRGTASAFLFRDDSRTIRTFEKTSPSGFYQLAICLRAHNGTLIQNGRFVRKGPISRGGLNLYCAGEHIAVSTHGPWEMLVVFMEEQLVADIFEQAETFMSATVPTLVNPRFSVDPLVLDASLRVASAIRQNGPFGSLRVDLATQDIAIQLLSAHSSLNRSAGKASAKGLAPWQLSRAYEAMNDLQDFELSLSTLAKAAGCSPSHFSRAFKASTSLSPFEWLLRRKIDRAKELLTEKDKPLSEVALEVGFAAQPQFTIAFRRVTGMTPGLWRKMKLQ